jgi:(R,R)-butanediol dehydrogenase/meso-butanediol dehydrogenase/diacetyl reductase
LTAAARLHGPRDLRIEPAPTRAPDDGEIVVRVAYAGVCGSDLHVWRTGDFVPAFPVTPGHEVAGVVEHSAAAGPFVGEAVVLDSRVACRTCAACRAGAAQLCAQLGFVGEVCDGGFAQRVVVAASDVFAVPAGLPLDLAVLAEPVAVALHATRLAERLADSAERIVIFGGGPIGVLHALVLDPTREVVIVEPATERARLAASVTGRRVVPTAAGLTPPDVVFDCAGYAGSLATAAALARPGATVVAVALHERKELLDANDFVARELRLVGAHVFQDEIAEALTTLANAQARFRPVVTSTLSLAELPAHFARAAAGVYEDLKVIVDPTRGQPR